jgi:exodeoxyribonuclease V alpha subunit
MDTFIGTVERVTYQNPDNDYRVLRVMPERKMPAFESREGLVTVVGIIPIMGLGETAEFTGKWVDDSRYGIQMRVERARPTIPTTEQGITRYLASGIVPGIGPKTAEKIVNHFGAETINILNQEPGRLSEVPRLKASLAEKLAAAWAENFETRQVMIYLQSYGVSSRMASRIFEEYKGETIERVQENPYTLAEDVFGIGFIRADGIALNMGTPRNAPARLESGLSYVLGQLSNEGHTYAPREMLIEKACELLQVEDRAEVEAALDTQCKRLVLMREQVRLDDGTVHDAIYLRRTYNDETDAALNMKKMINERSDKSKKVSLLNWTEYMKKLTEHDNFLTPTQQGAIKSAFTSKISVLTGGPGTGKTTTIDKLIEALNDQDWVFYLAAPTGRAAKRLSEATDCDAVTIHRLLGFNSDGYFEYNENSKLKLDMLIIDEASMLDMALFAALMRAMPEEAHLVLVGDIDQLPSVGAGNVLRDIINSGMASVTRLEQIFRQQEQSHIVVNAHRINSGEAPHMHNQSEDFFFFNEEEPVKAAALVVDIVKNRLPEKFDVDPMKEVQVIAPMYRGPAGVNALNDALQAALNASEGRMADKKIGGVTYRVGDKVMQTRNNYDKEVFNGDIGIIRAIDNFENTIIIRMGDRTLEYTEIDVQEQIMHAYCISTHRSQGSEYPVVVMPLLTQHYMMLQRNLLYTAITRARRMVVLVGSRRAVHLAVKNNKVAERYSGLQPRLRAYVLGR